MPNFASASYLFSEDIVKLKTLSANSTKRLKIVNKIRKEWLLQDLFQPKGPRKLNVEK